MLWPPSDRLTSSSSYHENVLMKQVISTHAPDDQVFYVRALFEVGVEILDHSIRYMIMEDHTSPGVQLYDDKRKLADKANSDILELFPCTICEISCEMSCTRDREEAHASTINILNMLSKFTWEAKVVLSFVAFAVNFGEFWLVYHHYLNNPLAKAVALVKQLPDFLEQADYMQPRFRSLDGFIKAMVKLTKDIIELDEIPEQYISPEAPERLAATKLIPTAAYWIIRGCIACASQITSFIGMANENMEIAMESWEILSITYRINSIGIRLSKQLRLCEPLIKKKKENEAYENLLLLFETPHVDNMKILQALVCAKDDQPPLFHGISKQQAGLDVLRRKNVLLLISDMDILDDEISILREMYMESRRQPTSTKSQFKMVWLPIADMSIPLNIENHLHLREKMPWYSIYHPSQIEPAVVRYIEKIWKFNKKLMLVVLDPQGRVVNQNALNMVWIWGSIASPFTSNREEALWREETWRIELIVDGIDPDILSWIVEERYICLYGGEDLQWIREFTSTTRDVAEAASITLQMVYVGKSKSKGKLKTIVDTVRDEKLSYTFNKPSSIWFFWVRLESMWHSKLPYGKTSDNDTIMQEITRMLAYDNANPGWALFSGESGKIAQATGDTMLKCLMDFGKWKHKINQKGFLTALHDHLIGLSTEEHCSLLVLTGLSDELPNRVVCAECKRSMEKYIMYCCCRD